MSVEAILLHFEAIFLKLILQALAVFQMFTTGFLSRHRQCINNYFDPSVDLINSKQQLVFLIQIYVVGCFIVVLGFSSSIHTCMDLDASRYI